MGSVFVNLAELARRVRAPDGVISTSAFLELCRQVLPVLGASLLQALVNLLQALVRVWVWRLSARQTSAAELAECPWCKRLCCRWTAGLTHSAVSRRQAGHGDGHCPLGHWRKHQSPGRRAGQEHGTLCRPVPHPAGRGGSRAGARHAVQHKRAALAQEVPACLGCVRAALRLLCEDVCLPLNTASTCATPCCAVCSKVKTVCACLRIRLVLSL